MEVPCRRRGVFYMEVFRVVGGRICASGRTPRSRRPDANSAVLIHQQPNRL